MPSLTNRLGFLETTLFSALTGCTSDVRDKPIMVTIAITRRNVRSGYLFVLDQENLLGIFSRENQCFSTLRSLTLANQEAKDNLESSYIFSKSNLYSQFPG